jgi:hypothetical protein
MRRKREKKYEMGEGEGGCMCVVGEKKKERQRGYMGGGEKKKKWGVGSGVYEYGGKKGRVEKKEEKKIEKEKTKLVLFVCSLYLVRSVKL